MKRKKPPILLQIQNHSSEGTVIPLKKKKKANRDQREKKRNAGRGKKKKGAIFPQLKNGKEVKPT